MADTTRPKEGNTITIMLLSKASLRTLDAVGEAVLEKGHLRAKPELIEQMAQAAAKCLHGTVVKTWFDTWDEGYFAEIETPADSPDNPRLRDGRHLDVSVSKGECLISESTTQVARLDTPFKGEDGGTYWTTSYTFDGNPLDASKDHSALARFPDGAEKAVLVKSVPVPQPGTPTYRLVAHLSLHGMTIPYPVEGLTLRDIWVKET